MNLKVEELFELYQEICKEACIEWTLEGWKFFDTVMVKDYETYCQETGTVPNRKHFKRNCILIAMDMVQEVERRFA